MRKSGSNRPPRHEGARSAFHALGKAIGSGDDVAVRARRKELSRRGKKGAEVTARKRDIAREIKKLAQEKRDQDEAERAIEANEDIIPVDPRNPETPDSYR